MADHARDVNILIWTSRKSVDHGTNDRVMVHGDGTRVDGRRSGYKCLLYAIDAALRPRRRGSFSELNSLDLIYSSPRAA